MMLAGAGTLLAVARWSERLAGVRRSLGSMLLEARRASEPQRELWLLGLQRQLETPWLQRELEALH